MTRSEPGYLKALEAGYSVESADWRENWEWIKGPLLEITLNEMPPDVRQETDRKYTEMQVENFVLGAQMKLDLHDYPMQFFVVRDGEGNAVGFTFAQIGRGYFDGLPKAILLAMYVMEAHRRRGVGSLLTVRIQDWGLENGAEHMHLSTGSTIESEGSRRFYKALGFQTDWITYTRKIEELDEDAKVEWGKSNGGNDDAA